MDKAIQVQAELLARRVAKVRGTESKLFIDGGVAVLLFAARNPLVVEMLVALTEKPEEATPSDGPAATGEG